MLNVRLACDHLFGKLLFTWLSLVMSMMVSFVLSFFPRDVLDEILNLIESVSEDFPSYSFMYRKFCVIFSNFTPHTQGLFMIQPEQFERFYMARCPICFPAKYQPNLPGGFGEVIWTVCTIYGHGGHLEFQIMTHFSLVLYIHHINAKYEISFRIMTHFSLILYNIHVNAKYEVSLKLAK